MTPNDPGEKREEVRSETTNRSRFHSRMQHYASLRSAERTLLPSVLELQREEVRDKAEFARTLLETLHAEQNDTSIELMDDEWAQCLRDIDDALDDYARTLRQYCDGIAMPQWRATLPQWSVRFRHEVLELLHLLLGDEPHCGDRLHLIEYLITLLSTVDEDGQRRITCDPVALSSKVQAFCKHQAEAYKDDLSEFELEIHQAAGVISESPDPEPLVRQIRNMKAELGPTCFAPPLLRAIVNYNVHLTNILGNRFSSVREMDADFDNQFEMSEEGNDPALSQPGSTPHFASSTMHAQPTCVSIFEAEGPRMILDALERRLGGLRLSGSTPQERMVLALDTSGIGDYETDAICSTKKGETEELIAYTVWVGLAIRILPTIHSKLEELGISSMILENAWVTELNEKFKIVVKKYVSAGNYQESCHLSEVKSQYLLTPLSTLARQRAANPPRKEKASPPSVSEYDPQQWEDQTAKPKSESKTENESRAQRHISNETSSLSNWRQHALTVATAVAIGYLAVTTYLTESNREVYDLKPRELSSISAYLSSAYRNDEGRGHMVIGRIAPKWFALSPGKQYRQALAMTDKLARDGVRIAMIYDERQQLVINYSNHALKSPQSPNASLSNRSSPQTR